MPRALNARQTDSSDDDGDEDDHEWVDGWMRRPPRRVWALRLYPRGSPKGEIGSFLKRGRMAEIYRFPLIFDRKVS